MGPCSKLVPKKFLCSYSLKFGAKIIGIVMFCISVAITIALIIQVCDMKNCENCDRYPYIQAYSINVVACIYAFFMCMAHLWLLWGLRKEKASVVLGWVVINVVWLIESTALLIVMLCVYSSEVYATAWLASYICAMIGLGIEIYLLLVVYGHWLELKKSKEQVHVTNQ